ncbi:MAG: hypothetical protein K9I82_15375 [Chitinophagaceae bacterium]|nr:hypothetical protein [Chitinophagaceae bacterium]
MKNINHFLNCHLDAFSQDSPVVDFTDREIENVNSLFLNSPTNYRQIRNLKFKPSIQTGQIWTVKNEYDDFQGITHKTSHPFIVLVNKDPGDIENEVFVRVLVISPFIEMGSNSDEVCYDSSIIGFPFLIETWNNQPVLTEILEEYLGYYDLKSNPDLTTESLELVNKSFPEISNKILKAQSENQLEFRSIEISRAKYINHSVRSLLSFLENRQSQDVGVVISIFNNPEYPKFYIGHTPKDSPYSLAAKSGIENEDKYLLFENANIPFKIFIRKNEYGFILSVNSTKKMQLFKDSKEEFAGLVNQDRTVFSNLSDGNYTLLIETVEHSIKIRLK